MYVFGCAVAASSLADARPASSWRLTAICMIFFRRRFIISGPQSVQAQIACDQSLFPSPCTMRSRYWYRSR